MNPLRCLLLVMGFLLIGCDSRSNMQERFPDSRAILLTDEQGHRYSAKHHIGSTYTLEPIDR